MKSTDDRNYEREFDHSEMMQNNRKQLFNAQQASDYLEFKNRRDQEIRSARRRAREFFEAAEAAKREVSKLFHSIMRFLTYTTAIGIVLFTLVHFWRLL